MLIKRSWFRQNGLFYTILALVLVIHLCLLALRMFKDSDLVWNSPKDSMAGLPLKLKIIGEKKYQMKIKKQIVQSEADQSLNPPIDTRFMSDKNRKVDRQTIAKKIDVFKAEGKGKANREISLSDLSAFDKNHDPIKEGAKELARIKKDHAKSGKRTDNPSEVGLSASNDYVEAVAVGDATNLNTTEYKYYGFFLRIRQKLEQFWGRSIQAKAAALISGGRQVASDSNLITSLEVTLNDVGDIVAIAIKGTSGVKELDDAAVESFNEAGPFPNPPRGLIENGLVKVEWGFVVQASQGLF